MTGTFEEQDALLRAQVAALRAGPSARLRRFRALEYVCQRCGDVLLEVLNTSPWRVVVTTALEPHPDFKPPPSPGRGAGWDALYRHGREAGRDARDAGRPVRTGERDIMPVPDDDRMAREHASTVVMLACRCQQQHYEMSAVAEDLRSGIKRRTIGVS